jgi:hypothetical protein
MKSELKYVHILSISYYIPIYNGINLIHNFCSRFYHTLLSIKLGWKELGYDLFNIQAHQYFRRFG